MMGGHELTGNGAGYWSMSASSLKAEVHGFGRSVGQHISIDPASNGGGRAEVVCCFRGKGTDGAFPGSCEVRYALDRHSTTLYASAVMTHGAGDPPFRMGEGRFVLKLKSDIFNISDSSYLTIT